MKWKGTPSAATLPIGSCQLLAMRFLPMESHLAPPQDNTAATCQSVSRSASQSVSQPVSQSAYQPPIPHSRLLPPRPTIPTLLSPPPPPLLICLPMSGQWHPPQTEHSGGPLGDPSARVFEVFLIVSQSGPSSRVFVLESTFCFNLSQWLPHPLSTNPHAPPRRIRGT